VSAISVPFQINFDFNASQDIGPTFGQSNPQRDVDYRQRSKGGHVRSCHASQECRFYGRHGFQLEANLQAAAMSGAAIHPTMAQERPMKTEALPTILALIVAVMLTGVRA
jgi:hypothetical protein